MRYGVNLPPFGDFADAAVLADLAQEAEAAGWDGVFIWDHLIFDPSFHPICDPWVGLSAIAMRTQHLRIGTMLTPLPRRRPWQLARETASIDRLSGGRLILSVGIGDPAQWDFGFFGEDTDAKRRAAMLDEGLAILHGLWRGEPFSFKGDHYNLEEVVFRPTPAQHPRIPIWVGGWWPNKPPMRRAARWDGVIPGGRDRPLTPDDWRDLLAYVRSHRTSVAPFDVVHAGANDGSDPAADAAFVAPYIEAGVTWWIESIDPWRFGWKWEDQWKPEASHLMRERIRRGPPRQ